ncbi:MAG: Asp-tRNA(Asn)/Glu-tRNA(Gln) amidotransferase subunit GatA [Candidatus Saccharimonadales bacterium]
MSSQWLSISEHAASVNNGKTKAIDLVRKSLKIIEDQSDFKAIIATIEKRAIERAEQIDKMVADGRSAGRLAGVPFIAKDNFLVYGAETTAASNILKGFNAPYQATAIERLEAEGAICVAKANLDAFAHGASTENSDFFTTLNPHDKSRVPGGSSGGSAAAVVLDLAVFAVGSDTGGSIRQPASFCGCVGFKPSYGLVSRSGVVAMASSTDTIGPLARTVADAAIVIDVVAGPDHLDGTTIERQMSYIVQDVNLSGKKVGIISDNMGEGLAKEVLSVTKSAIDKLKTAGAEVSDISIPSIAKSLAVYYILCPAEVSSNLSRYDGQRFGYSSADAADLEASYKNTRGQGFGKEAKRRIMIGTYVLSSGFYDAYYKRAQTVRTKLIEEFEAAFKKVDYLVCPVAPTTAFKIGQNSLDPLQMYLADVLTAAPNLVGNPSISIPAGHSNGLPIGLQIMAPTRADAELLGFAEQAEKVLA